MAGHHSSCATQKQSKTSKKRFQLRFLESSDEVDRKYAQLRKPWYPERAVDFLLLDPTRPERQAVLILTSLMQNENITRFFRQMAWAVIDTSLSARR
ncbi:hypothetical protein [Mesorhizobium muleiense]|uniref:hypothetical protein n=1 Tax=Mesorhizobium muleiense TaxID=1004279 RepID=UPI001F159A28|nr:hypothetical protein [Mesorhizobium muleiense]MCF6112217.1 hypothetical protein [Mesorhizobium muleiense]